MEYIGYDSYNNKLKLGDICSFKIDKVDYEGIISYDDSEFAFVFNMRDDNFPCVLMNRVDLVSIKRIINIYSTKVDGEYKDYQKLM